MSHHTSGPWRVSFSTNFPDQQTVQAVGSDRILAVVDRNDEQDEANVSLIALAPTMLDCLSHIWEVYGKQLKLNDVVMIETIMKQAEGN